MKRPPQLPITKSGFRISTKAVAEAVRQLRRIGQHNINPEDAHETADAILLGLLPPEVRAAYDEIAEGFYYS